MDIIKRSFIFIFAVFCCGLGIAASTQADLGTTPISTLPYVLTFITPFSFGVTTIVINICFIILQILIQKKDFRKLDYFQVFVAFLFGSFIEFGMYLTEPFKSDIYINKIILLAIGSAILALGVYFEVCANLLYVPGEGLVRAIAFKKKDFGRIKIIFDIILCILSIIISFIFLHKIQGLREGTILSAILVGSFVCLYQKIYKLRFPL